MHSLTRLQNAAIALIGSVAILTVGFVTPAAAQPTIDVVATNWHFTPSTISVEAGQTTTLRLTSTSGTHGIASDELGIAATTIMQGRFVEVSFTPHTAGTFPVHCSLFCGAGHADMVLTVIVNAAATPQPTTAPTPAPTPKPVPTPKPLVDDRHYVIVMMHRDQAGLQMAQLASKNAHRAEIRALAKSLAGREAAAIAQLQRWYKAWYGSGVPAMPATGSQSMPMLTLDPMGAITPETLSSAPDFDRAFMVGAIAHESMGASLSIAAEEGLRHPELRAFARSDASAQMNDVQTLWRWYVKWYPEK
jgi:uncharacterized protein (DUF305 family)